MGDLRTNLIHLDDYDAKLETMADVFEKQVDINGNKIGLVVGNRAYKYSEINDKANELAAAIKAAPEASALSNSERLVALFLDRTEYIVFGILGAWKAGVAYVPIDPNYPAARINTILADCNPFLILTDLNSKFKIPASRIRILDIMNLPHYSAGELSSQKRKGTDLAIVIYTSGTTGIPKGVMIQQSALVNQCLDYPIRYSDLDGAEVVVSLFNYAFNAFMEPVTLAYSQGFCLVIVPFELLLNPGSLVSYFIQNGVTHIDATPSLASKYDFTKLITLKRIAVGGEPLTKAHLSTFLSRNPSIRVFNIYGNSEGTLCTLTQDSTDGQLEFGREVYGKKAYLLSSDLKPVPIGAVGEICLVGKGVAKGYLNNSQLTAEKFLEDSEFGRLYRTGDLGVRHSNGGVVYVGRKDLQVKIRGIRVEIAEIEYVILKMSDAIDRAAVVCDSSVEGNQLIGYYSVSASQTPHSVTESEILSFLRTKLPEYMVPIRIYHLSEFPLTSNGKLNRAELKPPPEIRSALTNGDEGILREGYTENEITLCQLWESVLSLAEKTVDRSSNFFSLGGNSLLAIKVITMVKEALGITLNSVRIMEKGGGFGSFLEEEPRDGAAAETQIKIPVRDAFIRNPPLSTSQERILQSDSLESFIFEFECTGGHTEEFIDGLKAVVARNEILRTVYPASRFGMRTQKIQHPGSIDVQMIGTKPEMAIEDKDAFVNEVLDIAAIGPVRIGIFESEEEVTILVMIHGIALDSDGVMAFVEELKSGAKTTESIQYADYAVFQRNYLPDDEGKAVLSHWKEVLGTTPLIPRLMENGVTSSVDFKLSHGLRSKLQLLASKCGVSLNSVFLTAHFLLIHSIDQEGDITTAVVTSGRNHPQLYSTLGNFSQLVPISKEFTPTESLSIFMRSVEDKINASKTSLRHFPLDVAASALGIKNLLSHSHFRFVFDSSGFNSYDNKVKVGSAQLRAIRKDVVNLGKGTQLITSVDTAGLMQVKISAGSGFLASTAENRWRGILAKMNVECSETPVSEFF